MGWTLSSIPLGLMMRGRDAIISPHIWAAKKASLVLRPPLPQTECPQQLSPLQVACGGGRGEMSQPGVKAKETENMLRASDRTLEQPEAISVQSHSLQQIHHPLLLSPG